MDRYKIHKPKDIEKFIKNYVNLDLSYCFNVYLGRTLKDLHYLSKKDLDDIYKCEKSPYKDQPCS